MSVAAAAGLAEAAVKVLADYVASTKEPPEEVLRAWERITALIAETNARVQALGPIVKEGDPPC